MSPSDIENIWSGGTVRVVGNGLVGGLPGVHVTGVGFGEVSLRRLIASHVQPAGAKRAERSSAPAPAAASRPTSDQATPATGAEATTTSPSTPRRVANPSAIPPGAITVTVSRTTDITGLGRTTVNNLMDEGTLERVKVSRRTLIKVASIRRMLGRETDPA